MENNSSNRILLNKLRLLALMMDYELLHKLQSLTILMLMITQISMNVPVLFISLSNIEEANKKSS